MINKATVKYIQSLQDKKFRDIHGAFIAEGPKVVTELLNENNFACEAVYCTKNAAESLKGTTDQFLTGELNIIEDFELEKISALKVPNSMLAVFKKNASAKPVFPGRLVLALDDLQDPGNLGTIIRAADWFGVKDIVCSAATADCYNPKVVQSTMASLGRVNVFYGDLKDMLKNTGVKKYAAVIGGLDIRGLGKLNEGIIIIGNESKGISEGLLLLVDAKISVMKTGEAESLNAGVAAGIILYAVS